MYTVVVMHPQTFFLLLDKQYIMCHFLKSSFCHANESASSEKQAENGGFIQ